MHARPQDRADTYLIGLDPLRFFAAILVSLAHLGGMDSGNIGVEIFFVISGLVISQSAVGSSALDFSANRLFRLYPAAWLATLCSLVVVAAAGPALVGERAGISPINLRTIVSSMLLVGNHFIAYAYWTLPIELMFYAAVACVLATGIPGTMHRFMLILGLASAAFVGTYACVIWQDLASQSYFDQIIYRLPLARYGLFFALGYYFSGRPVAGSAARRPVMAILIVAGLVEIGVRASQQVVIPVPGRVVMGGAMAALWLGALLVIGGSIRFNGRLHIGPRWRATLRIVGLLTYPFYLLHQTVGGAILMLAARLALPGPAASGLAILGSGVVAYVIVRFGEPPLRRLLRATYERRVRPVFARAAILRPVLTARVSP